MTSQPPRREAELPPPAAPDGVRRAAGHARARTGGTARSARRQLVGLGVLVAVIAPAYALSRPDADAAARVAAAGEIIDDAAEAATAEIDLDDINTHIKEVAARYGVSPRLVAAIIEAESEFNWRAVSPKGARGLMQLMPATASSLNVRDSFDPFENIEGGVRHLRRLMDRFDGNLPLVLAAYNAGETTVVAYGGVPPYRETRRYVARILRRLGREGVTARSRAAAVSRHGLRATATQAVWVPAARPRTAEVLRAPVAPLLAPEAPAESAGGLDAPERGPGARAAGSWATADTRGNDGQGP